MGVLQTRVDDSTREAAEKVLNGLGISISDGIRMFLKQVHIDQGLPFQPSLERHIPNEATKKVIEQAEAGIEVRTAKTKEELFREIGL
ncbi:MAG: type II toxin-antitoxin system RelB/DinJ family antitoxin [Treponema sp.]|jgi:DNA-damage-inducible protein J|nr:type II toxin-antitoxin system RelB/DinJ family antitoxin [Treponema sp.]